MGATPAVTNPVCPWGAGGVGGATVSPPNTSLNPDLGIWDHAGWVCSSLYPLLLTPLLGFPPTTPPVCAGAEYSTQSPFPTPFLPPYPNHTGSGRAGRGLGQAELPNSSHGDKQQQPPSQKHPTQQNGFKYLMKE